MSSAAYDITIPLLDPAAPLASPLTLTLKAGSPVMVLGANGAGKTRLAVHVETQMGERPVQRLAAHKSLRMNDSVTLTSVENAQKTLRFGSASASASQRTQIRWGNQPSTQLLDDFDALLQQLFAENARSALDFKKTCQDKAGILHAPPVSALDRVVVTWEQLLPHRRLKVEETSIKVYSDYADVVYRASEMSDGERAIFYSLGQCLGAPPGCLLIIDEPEQHVHKAILWQLWSTIEQLRPDCAFLYLTHDVDFAVSHSLARKLAVTRYTYNPNVAWDLRPLPEETGLPDVLVAELVGSRRPVLFVEGDAGSLDLALYQLVYGGFKVVPQGSCDAVIHAVRTYRSSAGLHRVAGHGLVDGDLREQRVVAALSSIGTHCLPVAEIENVLLLPTVFRQLAVSLSCQDPDGLCQKVADDIFAFAELMAADAGLKYVRVQADAAFKKIDLQTDLPTLGANLRSFATTFDPQKLHRDFVDALKARIAARDLAGVLQLFKNKHLLDLGARALGLKSRKALQEKLPGLLGKGSLVLAEVGALLPAI
jgi:energy-coupling factor transporter ATP-binding protein EcfA2